MIDSPSQSTRRWWQVPLDCLFLNVSSSMASDETKSKSTSSKKTQATSSSSTSKSSSSSSGGGSVKPGDARIPDAQKLLEQFGNLNGKANGNVAQSSSFEGVVNINGKETRTNDPAEFARLQQQFKNQFPAFPGLNPGNANAASIVKLLRHDQRQWQRADIHRPGRVSQGSTAVADSGCELI